MDTARWRFPPGIKTQEPQRTINQTESMRPLRERILPLIHLSLLELRTICCDDRHYIRQQFIFSVRRSLLLLRLTARLRHAAKATGSDHGFI